MKLVLAGAIGGVFTIVVFLMFGMNPQKEIVQQQPIIQQPINTHLVSGKYENAGSALDFKYPAQQAMGSVVHITSSQTEQYAYGNQQVPDVFQQFFGRKFFYQDPRQQAQPRVRQATGSGVIISDNGYVVTNNHVIDNADEVEVTLHDNRNYKATVVGTDPSTDIALLKIDEDELTPIALGNSDNMEVGDWVLAVGNPFNLTSTVTAGIISAKGRNININKTESAVESFLQTDAAINPGNSGGALVNMNGELIGINTAIASPTGSYSGYAFAVPSNLVEKVVNDLKEYGVVQRGFLGVMIRNVNGDLADDKDLDVTEGVYVDSLMENSSAADAGIRKGDVILAVNGQKVNTSPELQQMVAMHSPGESITLGVDRNGKQKEIDVVLKNKEGNTEVVKKDKLDLLNTLGIKLENLSSKESKELDIDGGVKVAKITKGKISKQTNMKEGFVITKVDGHKVYSVNDVVGLLQGKKGGVLVEGVYPGYPGEYYFAFGI
ncbi:MAG: Do family serine endopeptidase [Chlorobi bacterium]|nr:Do family serine endopeptidase [Chlorobiota bacterium]